MCNAQIDADTGRPLYPVAMGSPLSQTGIALMPIGIEHQLDRINIGKIFKDLKLKA
jgi:hypothetical protein